MSEKATTRENEQNKEGALTKQASEECEFSQAKCMRHVDRTDRKGKEISTIEQRGIEYAK